MFCCVSAHDLLFMTDCTDVKFSKPVSLSEIEKLQTQGRWLEKWHPPFLPWRNTLIEKIA